MARLSITALFMALLAAFALAIDDGTRCSNKNGAVVNAIGKFCQNRNLRAPSAYAKAGMWSDNHKTFISISSTCPTSQYVPPGVCFSQFYHMCATGGPKGGAWAQYGWGEAKCQAWQITNH